MHKKAVSIIAAMGLAIPVIAGCASSGSKASSSTTDASGATTLEFWYSSAGESGKLLQSIVKDFNAKYQGKYRINATYQGKYSDAISKLAASAQTGDVPVLMQASDVQTSYLVDSKLATPMEKALGPQAAAIKADLVPLVKNYYTVRGTLWSMPMFVSLPTIYANKNMLAKAGVNPASMTSLDKLLDAVDTIHKKTGKPGLVYHQTAWFAEQFAAASGQQWCLPDNGIGATRATKLNLTNPKVIAIWDRIGDLYKQGAILNTGPKGNDALAAFVSQGAAMELTSSGALKNISEAKKFPLAVVPLPANAADGGAVPGGNSLWILKEGHNEKQLAGAAKFAEFIASDAVQKRTIKEAGYLPTTVSGGKAATGLDAAQKALLDDLDNATATPVTAGCHMGALNEVRTDVANAMQAVAKGAPAGDAFGAISDKTTKAIARYSKRATR